MKESIKVFFSENKNKSDNKYRLIRKGQKGSLTLEAAVTVPLFMLFCMALISFLLIIGIQMDIQTSMEETARSMGKKAYVLERFAEGEDVSEVDSDTVFLVSAGINPTVIKVWLLATDSLGEKIESSRIIGGAGGLYTYASSYDSSCGILDIVTHYDYSVPFLPKSFSTVRMVQRIRSHVWTGTSLTENGGSGDKGDGNTVYVTPTGSVYHLSPSCNYLDLSIHSIAYSQVSSARNKNGAKYKACEECAKKDGGTVYITDYGTSWHSSLGCSGLKRTVEEKDISDTKDMKLCSKCRKDQQSGGH